MKSLEFSPLSLLVQAGDAAHNYLQSFNALPVAASDYALPNIWGWAEYFKLNWAFDRYGLAWIKQDYPVSCLWAPVGDWAKVPWAEYDFVPGQVVGRVPEPLVELWQKTVPNRIEAQEDMGAWDYVYLVSELAELKGNRFHRKRNHYNQFLKLYNWEYKDLRPSDIEEVLTFQEKWLQNREEEPSAALKAENEVIRRVLLNWDKLPPMLGGLIYVDGELVSYTVCEELCSDMVVVHFEKADLNYRGLYQAINAMFLQHEGSRFTYVNREQDAGDEGLRKAKKSYNPVHYIKKYVVTFK